jgi:uncharacterized protein (TIGR04255 family)
MGEPRTLAKPPIREAVLEVLFNYPPTVNLKLLAAYGNMISTKYPIREDIISISGNMNLNEEQGGISRARIGYIFYSSDKKMFVQARLNGFSFALSNKSYTNWGAFKPLAFSELRTFVEFINPTTISRFSLRFINEIQIPSDQDFKQFVNLYSNVDIFGLSIRNYISKVELDNFEIGAIAVVSQLLSPPFDPTINMFLDIDVIMNVSGPVSLEFLSNEFDKLRNFKNRIFFSTLTDRAINSYD